MFEMRNIPVAGPSITQKEIDYVAEATSCDWYEDAGQFNARFERAFANYVGVRHAISLPSCTSAIHLSLAALGIGPGDEVVVPEATWIATAAPVTYVGAVPVFADIDPLSWCLDPDSFATCITPRTRAVIPVDLYGGIPDMEAISGVAGHHGIAVIEDAAGAIGSQRRGRRAGAFGDTGVFSFHGSKTLTTGEGGMLVTDRDELYARALLLRDHGRPPGDRMFMNDEVAFKYKMSSMQAALGLAQLERIDDLIARKRQIFAWYREELEGLPGVSLNHEPTDTVNSYWMVTIILDPAYRLDKMALMQRLAKKKIDSRPFFTPLSDIPAYRAMEQVARARERNRVVRRLAPYGVNLPSALRLEREDVIRVCRELKNMLHGDFHLSAAEA
jgi:perosamine synthetase